MSDQITWRIEPSDAGKMPVINSVAIVYKSPQCCIFVVELNEKRCAGCFTSNSVVFGNDELIFENLPFSSAHITSETARYTALVTVFSSDLLTQENLETFPENLG